MGESRGRSKLLGKVFPNRAILRMMETIGHRYGWRRDLPDPRDLKYVARTNAGAIPDSCLYLPLKMTSCYDQGSFACSAENSIAAQVQWHHLRHGSDPSLPSRLFLYWNSRGSRADLGSSLRCGMKAVARVGICNESRWPYDASKLSKKPTAKAFVEAKKHPALQYERVPQHLQILRSAIALDSLFVSFGFSVFQSFAQTGEMRPNQPGESMLGGHCATVVGYDNKRINGHGLFNGAFLCRDSRGAEWGLRDFPGHFWMPYSMMMDTKVCDDFWVLRSVDEIVK